MSLQPPPPPPPPLPPDAGGDSVAPRPTWQRGARIELRALGFTDVIDFAYNLYRLHWRALMGFVAILVVPVQFAEQYLTRNYRHLALLGAQPGRGQSGRLDAISFVVGGITIFFVQPLLDVGVAGAVASFSFGEDPGAGQILDATLAWVVPVLVVSLLFTLAVVGGLIALVIPGIVFLFRLQFAFPVVVIENRRGVDAIARAWQLTRGHFWRILGILLVVGIMAGIVGAVIGIPFALAADHAGSSIAWVIRAIGGSLGSVLTTPFSLLALILLYFDLRVRKEGLTLERLSHEVTGGPPS